jgi:hypothetical protein
MGVRWHLDHSGAVAQTFGLRQSAKANSTGTAINTLTATMADNGASGSFLTAEVADWWWLTSGFVDDVDYNSGTNFTKIIEQSTTNSVFLVSLWYFQNNAQTASPPAIVAKQNTAADTAGMSLIAKEWIGVATTGTPYEAEAVGGGSSGRYDRDRHHRHHDVRPAARDLRRIEPGGHRVCGRHRLHEAVAPEYAGQQLASDALEDREMAGGGTDTITVTWTTAANWVIVAAAFLPPSAATKSPPPFQRPWRRVQRKVIA